MGKIYDCIVIGGGISGIAFSHYLHRKGKRTLTLEKDEVYGGRIHTFLPQGTSGFWIETGAHTCYNSYTNILAMATEIGAKENIIPLRNLGYRAYSDGKQKNLMSKISYSQLLTHCFRIIGADKKGKTAREYFSPIVGKVNYDRLFRYAFRAVISQDADDYPAEIFLKQRKNRDKSQPRRFTFEGGLSSFVKKIVWYNGLEIRCRTEITQIVKEGGIFVLTDAAGESFRAGNIAFAVDPQTASRLLQPLENDVAALLSTISVNRSESASVVVRKNALKLKESAGLIPLTDELLSVVSRDVVSDDSMRGFTFHFAGDQRTEDEKMKLICRMLNVRMGDICARNEVKHLLPAMRLDHLDMAKRVDSMRNDRHIFLTGNYYYGLSLEDCIIRAKEEADRCV